MGQVGSRVLTYSALGPGLWQGFEVIIVPPCELTYRAWRLWQVASNPHSQGGSTMVVPNVLAVVETTAKSLFGWLAEREKRRRKPWWKFWAKKRPWWKF